MISLRKLIYRALYTSLLPLQLFASSTIDLSQKIVDRNELVLATQKIKPFLTDSEVKHRLSSWLAHSDNRDYVSSRCQLWLRPHFPSEKILGPLCYYIRQDDPERQALYYDFIRRYLLESKLALREISEDPQYSEKDRARAGEFYKFFLKDDEKQIKKCFAQTLKLRASPDFDPFPGLSRCLHENLPRITRSTEFTHGIEANIPYFAINLAEEFPNHPGHAISETSWIPGNLVEYFPHNDTSQELTQTLASKFPLMSTLYPLNGAGSLEAFLEKDPKTVFTEEEGFYTIANHPVWTQKDGIFPEILKTLNAAQESIFVDIFFLGSTMGAALAQHFIQLLEEKPQLKIFILRDNRNHFGHEKEMLPVYNFLLAYSMRHPDRLAIAEAYIEGHTSGLPPFMESLVTDEFLVKSGIQSHLDLYGRAVSDHSKVAVIDGKTKNPVALVGSKNWTDESGGICYDEVARVTGPAAAVVQDDYYYDMFYALLNKMASSYIKTLAQHGWSSNLYQENQSVEEKIANILRPFDLLDRDGKHISSRNSEIFFNKKGDTVLRTGFNNVDSTRTNAVDEVIQLILSAKKNIYIKDQFLFDRNVVLALIKAREKNTELDVRAILEPLPTTNPKGLPNLLYLDVLTQAGVKIKWKTLWPGWDPEVIHHTHAIINQEYHPKTISADGEFLISGSANKDQTTMYGSFREEQLHIFDVNATSIHDKDFLNLWNDENQTSEVFSHYDFVVPAGLKGFNGQPLTPDQFISIIRNIISILFDAQTMS